MQNQLLALYEAPTPLKKLVALSIATFVGVFIVMLALLPTSLEIAAMGGIVCLGVLFYSLYLLNIIVNKKYFIISGVCQNIETDNLLTTIQKRWNIYIQDDTGRFYKFMLYGKSRRHVIIGDRIELFVKNQGAVVDGEDCDTVLSYMALGRKYQDNPSRK